MILNKFEPVTLKVVHVLVLTIECVSVLFVTQETA